MLDEFIDVRNSTSTTKSERDMVGGGSGGLKAVSSTLTVGVGVAMDNSKHALDTLFPNDSSLLPTVHTKEWPQAVKDGGGGRR